MSERRTPRIARTHERSRKPGRRTRTCRGVDVDANVDAERSRCRAPGRSRRAGLAEGRGMLGAFQRLDAFTRQRRQQFLSGNLMSKSGDPSHLPFNEVAGPPRNPGDQITTRLGPSEEHDSDYVSDLRFASRYDVDEVNVQVQVQVQVHLAQSFVDPGLFVGTFRWGGRGRSLRARGWLAPAHARTPSRSRA